MLLGGPSVLSYVLWTVWEGGTPLTLVSPGPAIPRGTDSIAADFVAAPLNGLSGPRM